MYLTDSSVTVENWCVAGWSACACFYGRISATVSWRRRNGSRSAHENGSGWSKTKFDTNPHTQTFSWRINFSRCPICYVFSISQCVASDATQTDRNIRVVKLHKGKGRKKGICMEKRRRIGIEGERCEGEEGGSMEERNEIKGRGVKGVDTMEGRHSEGSGHDGR